jgi:hypothetical protein
MSRTLRSRTGIGAGATIALCLAALSASAQERPVTSRQDRGDTVKINMSGAILMDMIYRSPELSWMTDFVGNAGGFGPQESDGETTAEGRVSLRFDAELSDKISAVVELQHKRVDGGIDRFTGTTSPEVDLRTAALKINDFFQAGLSAQMGLVEWSFDVRGKGSSFAFDPRNSQQLNRNLRLTEDSVGAWATRGAAPNELEPVGVVLSYVKDAWTLELVMLPVVNEGGNPSFDESLYAVDFWYNLESAVGKGSRIGLIAAVSGLDGAAAGVDNHSTAMVTVGAGVNLVFQGGVELYGEIYKQAGKVGRDAGGDDAKAAGYAFQAGLDYHLQGNENNIWVGINLTVVSGDSNDDPTDRDADAFMSYENVNDLLILENQYFGVDLDTNYTAVKIKGGITFGKLDVTAIIGIVSATEELTNGPDDEDKFGNEFDVNARYNLNKQVALTVNFGVLVSSDILEEAMGAAGEADDRCMVGSVGFDVRW